MLGKIKKDILGLRGKTVSVYGQPCTIDKDCGQFTIDIVNVIDSLKPYEVNTRNASRFIDRLDDAGIIDSANYKSNNTYNFGAPVSNDFYFYIYPKNNSNGVYIVIAIHRFGDVRGNYSDEAVLLFDSVEEFYEVLLQNDKHFYIDINNNKYDVNVSILRDTYEVYDNNGYYITSAYGEYNDVIKQVSEVVNNG